ncbi:MAG: helix-turn-helix domain-containing protein [Lachnospiraceae bacterium]|jgi:DNA-binding transcriptional regulator YiaG|nr:helix-turn-helix domain-containing protein [Lachnospiraceae bacterium]
MNVKKIRATTDMSQSEFANYFGIPVRTIQKWERNGSVPPEYIPKMMQRILELEKTLLEKV